MVAPSWAPPAYLLPRVTVRGYLSGDGKRIVLVFIGDHYSAQVAGGRLSLMTPLLDTSLGEAITMPLTWPAVCQLACTFGGSWQPVGALKQWITAEVIRRTAWADRPLRYALPAGLALKSWQPEAVRMLAHNGCLLEDAPRLGKTVTTIVGLAERALWGHVVLPIVVIGPTSVVSQWLDEFALWAPHWSVTAWRGGSQADRYAKVGHYQVYIAGYETARNDARGAVALRQAPLLAVKANTVIIDEYHWIKNPEAQRTKAVQRVARQAQLVVPLSGTPFTHDFSDTHPTMEVFEPGAYPAKERLRGRYCFEVGTAYGSKVKGLNKYNEAELRMSFLGRRIGRSQEDVRGDLAPKTPTTRVIELPAKYRKMYDDMEETMLAALDNGEEVTAMSTITKMQRLQQLSASAFDISYTYTTDPRTGLEVEHQHLHPKMPSWKIDAALEVLAEIEWQSLIFGISKPLVELAGQAAAAAGLRVGYIVGGQTAKVRDGYREAFQAGKLDVLAVVVQAGGTGITLNAARTEIFLQRPASLVDSLQAENRGVGETRADKPTLDIVDIFAHNTIDLRIREILHTKAGQLSEYLGDRNIVRQLFGGNLRPKLPSATSRLAQAS